MLVALVVLMRFTPLGLQMRGAVESRRLVQLDGVNAGRVVAMAWAVSGLMAGLAGVLLAPPLRPASVPELHHPDGGGHRRRRLGVLRSMPIAAVVAILHGRGRAVARATSRRPASGHSASLPVPALHRAGRSPCSSCPGCAAWTSAKDPLASVDPPTPPTTAPSRAPQIDRIIHVLWYVLLAAFVVSMLTWMPRTWENVFNAGLAFSIIFLSITLITGMGGQLSLCQATLAGVGAFTAGQLANHLGLSLLVGGLVGAVAGRGGGRRAGPRLAAPERAWAWPS